MLDGKYKFNEIEKQMQDFWQKEQVFAYNPNSKAPLYSVDTPPPTISGALHIGHVASYTQAEVMCRFKKMRGYNIFYPLGFDNNGLPTERLVEKNLNIRATDVSAEEFIKLCQNAIEEGVQNYKNLFKSLAFSVDWSLSYQTIDEKSRRISQRSFIELAKEGKAYRSQMPVQWCTECKTSIAQAEIETKEVPTKFYTLSFEVEKKPLFIATTRPEYLGACVAVIVNPKDSKHKHLIGKEAVVPLYGNKVPIIADDKAELEKGTGVVMCCTYGDETDVEWCQKHKLPYVQALMPDGKMNEELKYVGGKNVFAARGAAVEELKNQNKLIEEKDITHLISVHDRCDTPVELLPSQQWFIKVMDIKDEILKLAAQVEWRPESMKKRLEVWVENLNRDWLISRQRYFGVHLPVWYCKDCGHITYAKEEQLPLNPSITMPKEPCENCGSNLFEPEKDVMDTWATSSVTQLINASWKEKEENSHLIPMSVRSQAREIIRTWAFYTLVKSYYHTKEVPWKTLMINGWVMFDKKEKISKSKHNLKTPQDLIEEYSADAIRYWATETKLGSDMIFTEEDLVVGKRFVTKLWNASKFSIMQLKDYKESSQPKTLLPIDNWLLEKWQETKTKALEQLDRYEIGLAKKMLDKFFWDDYCDNYLEIAKERLYQPDKHGKSEQLSGQYTIFNVLYEMLQMFNIFVPHISEYIYQEYYKAFKGEKSIALTQIQKGKVGQEHLEFGEFVKETLKEVRKYKAQKGVSMKEPFDKLILKTPKKYLQNLEKTKLDLYSCTSAVEIIIEEDNEFFVQIKD